MIDANTIELFLRNDEDIQISDKLDEGTFRIKTRIPDSSVFAGEDAEMIVTIRVNPEFVMLLSRVQEDHLGFALAACENSNAVGLISFGDGFMMRAALLSKFSEPVAINNLARALALAKLEYESYVRAG
ncbi:hypothetical protein [Arthrobacter sp. C152]